MRYDFLLPPDALGYAKHQVRALDPLRLCDDPRGLSGTEVNALGLADRLATEGHTVRVWSSWRVRVVREYYGWGSPDGRVEYWQLADGPPDDLAPVAIAFHDATCLQKWPAPLKVAWHQTLTPPHATQMATENVDLYISATERNAAHLSQYTNGKPWAVVPNGWDFGPYQPHTPVPGRLFYHTSPERGLHVLLRALPEIRRRVPEAHLVVWTRMETAKGHPAIAREIEHLLKINFADVELHPGGGSRREVLASLATAACVAYPSEPPMPCEVMPVSLMEACATGVPVVTAPSDGFEEVFFRAIQPTASPASRYMEQFIETVHTMLTYPPYIQMMKCRGQQWAGQHTFAHTALRFQQVIAQALAQKEVAV